MGTIKYILWDIDGTLVDFDSAEVEGLKICFNKYNLVELTKEIIDNFRVFNDKYWNKYEKGQIPKKEAMEKRFIDLFKFIF